MEKIFFYFATLMLLGLVVGQLIMNQKLDKAVQYATEAARSAQYAYVTAEAARGSASEASEYAYRAMNSAIEAVDYASNCSGN